MAEKLDIPQVVYIRWLDSAHHGATWTSIRDLRFTEGTLQNESVGFLLREDTYSYTIVQSKGLNLDEQEHIDGVMEIPKVAVTEFKIMTLVEKPNGLKPIMVKKDTLTAIGKLP